MTGRQKERDNKARIQAEQEAAAAAATEAAADGRAARDGVFDPQTQGRLDGGGESDIEVLDDPDEEPTFAGFGGGPEERVFTGRESPEEIDAAVAARRQRPPRASHVHVVDNSRVKVRIDADIEQLTFGMVNGLPNNYDFREGLVYEVPLALAQHLDERALIRQWIG